jgi:hypothetical protein
MHLLWPSWPQHPCSRGGLHGKIIEADTWPTQMGDMCHVLSGISIIQRFLTHWHMAHIPCVHVISSDVSRPRHFWISGFSSFHLSIPRFSQTSNSRTFLSSTLGLILRFRSILGQIQW